jgi:chemotaxis protein methyltransferase CheR
MQLSDMEVPLLCNFIKELCGITLSDEKVYLIEGRLKSVARSADCVCFSDLIDKARRSSDATLKNEIIDAITTSETLFFRDESPFVALQEKILPELIEAKSETPSSNQLRIWSAACSTGQEPYSIAMILRESIPFIDAWDVKIMATDISEASIAHAKRGVYQDRDIKRGMNPEMLAKYFVQKPDGWQVRDTIKSMVSFRQIDLTKPFVGMGRFDIVFCRNVAIYFSMQVKRSLFERIGDLLTDDGHLFVGSSENLAHFGPRFTPQQHLRAVFYQPNREPETAQA